MWGLTRQGWLGPRTADQVWRASRGDDDRVVTTHHQRKSIGAEVRVSLM